MSRVFYHGAYKPPREFNWVVGVCSSLDPAPLLLRVSAPLGPVGAVGGDGGDQHGGIRSRVRATGEVRPAGWGRGVTANTLLRCYVLHVLFLPFIIVIFMAVHFWRVRKDGGISGPL